MAENRSLPGEFSEGNGVLKIACYCEVSGWNPSLKVADDGRWLGSR